MYAAIVCNRYRAIRSALRYRGTVRRVSRVTCRPVARIVLLGRQGSEMLTGTIIRKFAYRIEERPEGGFIARPIDPSMDTLEGATREEVQQKIETRLSELLGVPLDTFKLSDIGRIPSSSFKVTVTRSGRMLTPTGLEDNAGISPPPIAPAENSGAVLKAVITVIVLLVALYFFLHRAG